MKKELIEVGNLDSFVCPECDTFYADCNMILTPGAKDELSKRKIKLVRVEDAAVAVAGCCNGEAGNGECVGDDCEELVMGIAVLLKEEYGITDLAQLKEMSFKLADTVKANI